MKFIHQLAFLGVVALSLTTSVQAVQLSGSTPPPVTSSGMASTIERGGTIDTIDLRNRTIMIDRVKYTLAAKSERIHNASNKTDKRSAELRVGTQVRFNTSKHNYANQDQIVEIWIVGQTNPPTGKQAIRNTPGRNKPGNP